MSLPTQIANETVTRVRAVDGAPDSHGNVTKTWSGYLEIGGCSVQPFETVELVEGRQTVVSRWRWWGPVDADVTALDRIIFSGDTYEVDGSVKKWPPPLPYKEAVLRRVEE